MPLTIAAAITWLTSHTGAFAFSLVLQHVSKGLGLSSEGEGVIGVGIPASLLDEHLSRIHARLDEDRFAKFKGAFTQLRDAARRKDNRASLEQVLNSLHEIASLPELGTTGSVPNSQLRALAFLGIAAAHALLNESEELIAKNIIFAFLADRAIVEPFLGPEISAKMVEALSLPGKKSGPEIDYSATTVHHLKTQGSLRHLKFRPDGRELFCGSGDNLISIWDVVTGKQSRSLKTLGYNIEAIAFTPDGEEVVTGSGQGDCYIELWNTESGENEWEVDLNNEKYKDRADKPYFASIEQVAFLPDGQTFIVSGRGVGNDNVIQWRKRRTGRLIRTVKGDRFHEEARDISSDGKYIVLSLEEGRYDHIHQLLIRDTATGKLLHKMVGHQDNYAPSAVFSLDGLLLASAGRRDMTARLWYASTGTPLRVFDDHKGDVLAVAFSPDGKILASGAAHHSPDDYNQPKIVDNAVRLWDVQTGRLMQTFKDIRSELYYLAFSPTGKAIAYGSYDGSLVIRAVKE
jgi:WD40 repeat protein